VVGELLFTFKELNTFIIEGILNSRPILSLSADPNDSLTQCPIHCLIGRPLINLLEPNISSVPANLSLLGSTSTRYNKILGTLESKISQWASSSPSGPRTEKELTLEQSFSSRRKIYYACLGQNRGFSFIPVKMELYEPSPLKWMQELLKRSVKCLCSLPIK